MDRKVLESVLGKIEPALSAKDLIQVFACFCFGKEFAYAYDDVVALEFPYGGDFKPEVRGAVRGRVLLDFLRASRSKDVEFTKGADDSEFLVKAGRSKLKLPRLGTKDFQFERPDTNEADWIDVSGTFLDALGKAMTSMGRDPSHPWRLGVTISGGEKGFTLYSTDNKSAVKVFIKTATPHKVKTILPPRFCELLRDIGRNDPPLKLGLAGDWCRVDFTSGLRLFSKTISAIDLKSFKQVFESIAEVSVIEVPKGFDRCLERARVVLPFAKDPFTTIDIAKAEMRLLTESPGGQIRDRVTIDEYEDCSVRIVPDVVLRVLPFAGTFGVLPGSCVVFKGKNLTCLVTTLESVGGGDNDDKDEAEDNV